MGVGLVLVALAWPALVVIGNSWAVKNGIEKATDSIAAGELATAARHAQEARHDARDIRATTEGVLDSLWLLPWRSTAQQDARHLAAGLEQIAAGVASAAGEHPEDRGEGGGLTLSSGEGIDLVVLRTVLGRVDSLIGRLDSAALALERVQGDAPVLGPVLGEAAALAMDRTEPTRDALETIRPLAPVLPKLLGAEGEQSFLVALLNPAEQRYSGGASLSFTSLTFDRGRLTRGDDVIGSGGTDLFGEFTWKPVPDNPFHPEGKLLRLSTATLAPSWSVSGEELLRAWERRVGMEADGLVVVDVMALQALAAFTGPFDVPGYGTITSDNLAERLIGSYEEYTDQAVFDERRAGGTQLMNEFQRRLLSPSQLPGKLRSVVASAAARRLAVYHRDPDVARSIDAMGLSGDLSSTRHDYLGVFNQALTGQKSDYWQRRRVVHRVRVRKDGSARVRLVVSVFNDSPPSVEGVDPRYSAYVRRDNHMSLATFLPRRVGNLEVEVDRERVEPTLRSFYGRPFVDVRLHLGPQETQTLVLTYDVPDAAVRTREGLQYRLDVDPPGLVDPMALTVQLRWPDEYRPRSLPRDWKTDGDTATFSTGNLLVSPRWTINLARVPGDEDR